ncbi:GIN domain-containing protein [Jiulongibacter sediminis]|uniref:GIN domain-containing protein n=1 Tax=Jiulongibacter sediminis TaxID=1605367 RepID=UPI0026EE60DD|nr:DUF2807 domain-containing protein [Jiulongibacter sediminis]
MKQFIPLLVFSVFFWSCSPKSKETSTREPRLSHEARFTTFNIEDFSAIKINVDLGRLKLTLRQYDHPKMEVHKSYQKYVRFEPKGDTLRIYTENTPKSTEDLEVKKYINLFLPKLNYLETSVSRVTLESFDTPRLSVVNNSSALRLYDCRIKDLRIENQGLSNIQLDGNNYVDTIYLKNNEKSHLNSNAMVLKTFTLESKTLDNLNFTNVPENGFIWRKD